MARVFRFRNYSVYVLDERGAPHHRPHAHVKRRDQRVASVFLATLELFNVVERLPPELINEIEANQSALLEKWTELNDDG